MEDDNENIKAVNCRLCKEEFRGVRIYFSTLIYRKMRICRKCLEIEFPGVNPPPGRPALQEDDSGPYQHNAIRALEGE